MDMLYKNALFLNEEYIFERKDVCIRDGCICDANEGEQCIDASNYYVIPALTDIHMHGVYGVCANDGTTESYEIMDKHMKRNGMQGFLPTVITAEAQEMIEICKNFAGYKRSHDTFSLGLNVEGPFINPGKKGAHNEKHIIYPDIELFKRMYDASEGLIKLITVAPELPGAISFIKEASKVCRVAIGHSAADYDTAMRAFEAGAANVTHLFNAMNPINHREPGIIAAARDCGVYVELICDGKHIHPSVIRMVFSAFNKDKIILVSDAISATGLEDGEYQLGGLKTIVKNGVSTLEDGTLAGSTTNLLECVKKAVSFGIDIKDAIRAASKNPCNLINEDYKRGRYLILDQDLNLVA